MLFESCVVTSLLFFAEITSEAISETEKSSSKTVRSHLALGELTEVLPAKEVQLTTTKKSINSSPHICGHSPVGHQHRKLCSLSRNILRILH